MRCIQRSGLVSARLACPGPHSATPSFSWAPVGRVSPTPRRRRRLPRRSRRRPRRRPPCARRRQTGPTPRPRRPRGPRDDTKSPPIGASCPPPKRRPHRRRNIRPEPKHTGARGHRPRRPRGQCHRPCRRHRTHRRSRSIDPGFVKQSTIDLDIESQREVAQEGRSGNST